MRRLVYYALAFMILVSLVVFITWEIGHIQDLRELAVAIGLAAVGVATVMALFVAIIEKPSSLAEEALQKDQEISSPAFDSEVTQSGGVHFGQGSVVSVHGAVIGTLQLEGMHPVKEKEMLEGL
jgi:hypothetical protein